MSSVTILPSEAFEARCRAAMEILESAWKPLRRMGVLASKMEEAEAALPEESLATMLAKDDFSLLSSAFEDRHHFVLKKYGDTVTDFVMKCLHRESALE